MNSFFRNRSGHLMPLLCAIAMVVIWLVAVFHKGHRPGSPELYLIGGLMGLLVVCVVALWLKDEEVVDAIEASNLMEESFLDPWAMQQRLMVASDQPLPEQPTINNNSILYALLMMEELGETLGGMSAVMARLDQMTPEVLGMINTFDSLSHRLQALAIVHRESLTRVTIDSLLTEDEAVNLFDGTTDVAVVNCGFALASGLPGAAGYDEVARSNLSKRNPNTGKIDKTADGKWIKGSGFFKPNLAHVLFLQHNIND